MQRTSLFVFVLLTALSAYGFADDRDCFSYKKPGVICPGANLTLDTKVGYFFFSDAKMCKIYDQGGLDMQVSGSYPLWRWLQIYGSVEYLERHGRSLNDHQKTKIWEVPLSLGLKAVIPICQQLQYYLTLGPRYFFVHAHNNSSFVDRNMSQNGLGGFANMGFTYFPCGNRCRGRCGRCHCGSNCTYCKLGRTSCFCL